MRLRRPFRLSGVDAVAPPETTASSTLEAAECDLLEEPKLFLVANITGTVEWIRELFRADLRVEWWCKTVRLMSSGGKVLVVSCTPEGVITVLVCFLRGEVAAETK